MYRVFIASWLICVLYGYQRATKNDYILFQTNCGYLFLCIQDFYCLPTIKKLKTKAGINLHYPSYLIYRENGEGGAKKIYSL